MKCNEFKDWLPARDIFRDKDNIDALEHLNDCKTCNCLYEIDLGLEKDIQSAFHQQEIPEGLLDQIDLTLDQAQGSDLFSKLKLTGIITFFCLMVIAGYRVFFNTPFQYQNLRQFSEKAVASHLKGNTTMTFTADEIESALSMLRKELSFNVILPDLADKGYTLVGGRLCVLGKCKTAYLFYKKQGRISSLFIMDDDHIGFEMADGSRFSNTIKGFHTDIWKKQGQVYAMVY